MTDLTEFLLARIAEDEAVAQVATAAPWRVDERGSEKERDLCWAVEGPTLEGQQWPLEVVDVTYDRDYMTAEGGCPRREDADHIARHDPARVLAECDAKRLTLALLDEVNEQGIPRLTIYTRELLPRLLALPYADHPDYRAEWRP